MPGRNRHRRVHLPAGMYEVTGTAAGASGGRLRLRTDRVSPPIADWDVASFGTTGRGRWRSRSPSRHWKSTWISRARRTVSDGSIRAASLTRTPRGLEDREAKSGARYGPVVVFLMSGDAWMESDWHVGRRRLERGIRHRTGPSVSRSSVSPQRIRRTTR